MAAKCLPLQTAFSVRNTFLHCLEDEGAMTPVVRRPRSHTGPASLFTEAFLEAVLGEAPEAAEASVGRQDSNEACTTSETDVDEPSIPKKPAKACSFGEDLPGREASDECSDERSAGFAQLPRLLGSRQGHGPVGAALDGGLAARMKVRNTFVHFSDDSDDEGVQRRARTTRTVPARILSASVLRDESEDSEPSAPEPALAPKVQSSPEILPSQQQQLQAEQQLLQQQTQQSLPASTPEVKTGAAEPMYVEPVRPRLMKADSDPWPRLRVSIRNTFLHVDSDEDADGAEQMPGLHRRTERRSKTGPAKICFEDCSDSSDELDCATAEAARGPLDPIAAQEPQASGAGALVRRQVVSVADRVAAPPGACTPAAVPPGVMLPPVPGFNLVVSLLAAQLSAAAAQAAAAQATQPSRPAAAASQAPPPRQVLELRTAAATAPPATAAAAKSSPSKRCGDAHTTVVLKNLPLNYKRAMLLKMLDFEGFAGEYDYVYLPMDFNTKAGLGYAFVNLVDAAVVQRFWRAFDGYSKWLIPSAKVCKVSWSVPQQGLKDHVRRYRNSPLMHPSVPDEYRPALFSAGLRVAFPPPTKEIAAPCLRSRAAKGSRQQEGV